MCTVPAVKRRHYQENTILGHHSLFDLLPSVRRFRGIKAPTNELKKQHLFHCTKHTKYCCCMYFYLLFLFFLWCTNVVFHVLLLFLCFIIFIVHLSKLSLHPPLRAVFVLDRVFICCGSLCFDNYISYLDANSIVMALSQASEKVRSFLEGNLCCTLSRHNPFTNHYLSA